MRDDLLRLAAGAGCVASVIVFVAFGVAPLSQSETIIAKHAQSAAAFFAASITVNELHDTYNASDTTSQSTQGQSSSVATSVVGKEKVRILLVPGHEPNEGGTVFGGVYERDVAVDIANALAELLKQNPHYEVIVTRTKTAWNPVLQSYFDTHTDDIAAFRASQAEQMAEHLADGSVSLNTDQIPHNSAQGTAALHLYGINKWASENNIDITLHLHINDYSGRRSRSFGTYDGFAVYVPEHQYSNAAASLALGEAIAARISAYHATSTLPKEDAGVIEDQQLIAIGQNNSADSAALLIEYGYIYEPQFQKTSVRPLAVADYAYETYLGLQDFFNDSVPSTTGSMAFPYDWSDVKASSGSSGPGVYALQEALHYLGYYPPRDESFRNCSVSGYAGSCTKKAIAAYQVAHGLEATGTLGPQTRSQLDNDLLAS